MNDLEKSRAKIDEIDAQMARLFLARMEDCARVARIKREQGLPIEDKGREEEMKKRRAEQFENEELRGLYISFLEGEIELSKRFQRRMTEGMRVSYSGVPGSFAEIAARRIFPGASAVGFADFDAAYEAVYRGECECAVLPIENSYAGAVGRVMDLMFRGELFVSGVYTLPVVQNLLGIPGASRGGIKRVISHPQALAQCAGYIKEHGYETAEAANTARAAQEVSQKNDRELAAIASAETAKLYGLEILDHDLNASAVNSTRFAVFTRSFTKGKKDDRFILMFTVKDVAGALAAALDVIGSHGFNMKSLKSRPTGEKAWECCFYVEAEGDETTAEGKRMLIELARCCEKVKIAGHFGGERVLKGGEEE